MRIPAAPSARALLVIVTVLVVGVASVAVASSGGSTTVNACYAKKGGALRWVKDSGSCRSGETGVQWSKQGPRGPRGAPGSARAYGRVAADATLDLAHSKGIVRVYDFDPGRYCVIVDPSIDLSTTVAVVSLDGWMGPEDTAISSSFDACSEGSGADEVWGIYVVTNDQSGQPKPAAFSLMVP